MRLLSQAKKRKVKLTLFKCRNISNQEHFFCVSLIPSPQEKGQPVLKANCTMCAITETEVEEETFAEISPYSFQTVAPSSLLMKEG